MTFNSRSPRDKVHSIQLDVIEWLSLGTRYLPPINLIDRHYINPILSKIVINSPIPNPTNVSKPIIDRNGSILSFAEINEESNILSISDTSNGFFPYVYV